MADQASRGGLTRRQALRRAGGAAALALTGAGLAGVVGRASSLSELNSFPVAPAGRVRAFHSRPDLRPPTVATRVSKGAKSLADPDPGYLFLGPGPVSLKGPEQFGPLIADSAGTPVWFRPLAPGLQATNFARWRYRGKPALAWWEGRIQPTGYGQGEVVVLDHAYREIARVRAANGRSVDLHALTVTPRGTALFTCYPDTVQADLSSIGGPRNSQVRESIIQEVDIATGRLVFEWRSLQHIPVSASREPMGEPYDYLHVNSVQELPDGNLLVSARHTWAVYKLERRTGRVMWALGGKQSQFHMGPGTEFAWQHDARLLSDRLLTLFDNGTNGPIQTERQSRGLALQIDESRRKVTLGQDYVSSHKLVAGAMGSVQVLQSGHVMVGWGVASYTRKFTAAGELLSEFALPAGMYSYRGLWLPWEGIPHHRPKVSARRDGKHATTTLYASWNGATELTDWQVEAGPSHDQLSPLGVATSHGFETVIPLQPSHRYAAVTALDRFGRRLKRSRIIRL